MKNLNIKIFLNRSEDGCSDGVSCDFAHGQEELQEWIARRDFLRQKLAKAREDMLVMPDDFYFGKYNFLIQDWVDVFFILFSHIFCYVILSFCIWAQIAQMSHVFI